MTRIVMIEDSKDFANALKRALQQEEDLQVIEHFDCVSAAKQFMSSGKLRDADCILLDLQLPHESTDRTTDSMAGLKILQELRKTHRYYGTVIVLTNSQSASDGQRALEAGCDGYLCKQTKVSQLKELVGELKMAIRGDVILVSRPMRHVFMREELSAKEARLLDLLVIGKTWPEIARELSYSTGKAAANVGDRIFDKLLTPDDQARLAASGGTKRELAVQIWRSKSTHGRERERHN